MLTNTRTLSVEFGHCDPSGIVYNPNYFVWFDMSVHALLAHGGISLKSAIEQFGIDGIPVVEYQVKFLAPSRWGDRLQIESSVIKLHRCAFDLRHRIFKSDALAVECQETRACTAFDSVEGRVRARPWPQEMLTLLADEDASVKEK